MAWLSWVLPQGWAASLAARTFCCPWFYILDLSCQSQNSTQVCACSILLYISIRPGCVFWTWAASHKFQRSYVHALFYSTFLLHQAVYFRLELLVTKSNAGMCMHYGTLWFLNLVHQELSFCWGWVVDVRLGEWSGERSYGERERGPLQRWSSNVQLTAPPAEKMNSLHIFVVTLRFISPT